jgi:hypothetical protein
VLLARKLVEAPQTSIFRQLPLGLGPARKRGKNHQAGYPIRSPYEQRGDSDIRLLRGLSISRAPARINLATIPKPAVINRVPRAISDRRSLENAKIYTVNVMYADHLGLFTSGWSRLAAENEV